MNIPTPFAPQQDIDVGSLYSGTYLKADDLGGKTYPATIVAVERVEIPEQDGSVRAKAALTLQGWPAKLLCNKTNAETITAGLCSSSCAKAWSWSEGYAAFRS